MSTRDIIAERDNGCCVRCGKYCIGQTASIHHRKRRSQANKRERDQPQNLVLLCGTGTTGCHGWAHANVADAQTMGYLLHSWEDPAARPVYTKDGWKQPLEDGTYKTIN
ncbi:gp77 phage protein [Bifidobacterium magnum]|uniref:Gp77 phage protein n=2 Tax=Bifidobacterium magnum TaxID=1692 RepID=A0A087B9M6_9BIFI|nr:gp77 phage protein [Bifidobacterium magnum]